MVQQHQIAAMTLSVLLIGIAAKIESRTRRPWFDLQRNYYYRDVNGVTSPEDLRKALEHFHVVVSESDLQLLYSSFPSKIIPGAFDFAAFAARMYPKESSQFGSANSPHNHNNALLSSSASASSLQQAGRQMMGAAAADMRTTSAPPMTRFSETQVLSLSTAPSNSVGSLTSTAPFTTTVASDFAANTVLASSSGSTTTPSSSTSSASSATSSSATSTGEFRTTYTAGARASPNTTATLLQSTAPTATTMTTTTTTTAYAPSRTRGRKATSGAAAFPLTYNRSHAGRYNEHVVVHPSSHAPKPKPYPEQEYARHGAYVSTLEQPRFGTRALPEFSEVARRHNISRQNNRNGVPVSESL